MLEFLSRRLREPAECIIKMGTAEQEIADLYPFLTEVVVEADRESASVATLTLETRRDEHGRWVIEDAGVFAPWAPIRIDAAFGSYTEEVMRGYVREVHADYPDDPGATRVTVQCQDASLALDREHVRRAWGAETPVGDQLILQEILATHGLSSRPESGSGQSGLVLHQDSTDIRFLRQRAAANGYELIFHEGLVYFGPMRLDAQPQATILVYAGPDTHCYRLSIREDGHRPDAVAFDVAAEQGSDVHRQVVSPDLPPLGPETADSSASGLPPFVWNMSRRGGRNETELAAQAQRLANEQAMKVRGEGELDGSRYGHVLRVGEPVAVDGVGQRYSGVYYVDRVTHRFNVDGYRQSFTLLRNAYGDNVPATGNALAGLI